jgi:hypothetical protein
MVAKKQGDVDAAMLQQRNSFQTVGARSAVTAAAADADVTAVTVEKDVQGVAARAAVPGVIAYVFVVTVAASLSMVNPAIRKVVTSSYSTFKWEGGIPRGWAAWV